MGDVFPLHVGGMVKLGEEKTRSSSWKSAIYQLPPRQVTIWYTPYEVGVCGDQVNCHKKHVRWHHPLEERVYQVWLPYLYFFMTVSMRYTGFEKGSMGTLKLGSVCARQKPIDALTDQIGVLPLPNVAYASGVLCMGSAGHYSYTTLDENGMVAPKDIEEIVNKFYNVGWNDDDPMSENDAFRKHFNPEGGVQPEDSYRFFANWEKASLEEVLAAPLTPTRRTPIEVIKGEYVGANFAGILKP